MGITSSLFAVFCTLILPICVAIYLCRLKKGLWIPTLVGATTFFVFQILIRLPIFQLVLPNIEWYLTMSSAQPLLYALFLGATAGLVEEFGRYITMKLMLKNNRQLIDGIAFGVGHGGIEAILLVGINALINLFLTSQSVVPNLMFASGVERIVTLILHICWSIMVMKSIRERKPTWLFIAFITHTFIDAGAAFASIKGVSIWFIEVPLILCALLALVFIINEYKTKEEIK